MARKGFLGRALDKIKNFFVIAPPPKPKAKNLVSNPELVASILTRRVSPTPDRLTILEGSITDVTTPMPFTVPGNRIRFKWTTPEGDSRMTRWQFVGKNKLTGQFILGTFYNAIEKEIAGAGSDPDFNLSDIDEVTIERTH